MSTLYPLIFQPRFKERIWGGRTLETMYGKRLPPDVPIGESWEISDRPGDESVIANGPLAGRTLRSLMEERGPALLGNAAAAANGRFPLLCKILDAREKTVAAGAPTAARQPPRRAQNRDVVHRRCRSRRGVVRRPEAGRQPAGVRGCDPCSGDVAGCFHRIAVKTGDAMFLPSGRVHAIGAGLVIFEIQQNSDTTFRVHDWNRVGLDGHAPCAARRGIPRQHRLRRRRAPACCRPV